ncbi:peptidylprolyl isomerase [Pseudooceanicola nanhaiensis]|jgi:peptidyl-prolyl cis-trans isomerase SurA|uniref:Parvulin-like PPIase n=1 Tax=Pseudooceanicola nanhaiensis TaxID=375761 RepID=A0A917WAZ4_9RHOB|nr:peptidylprolyl isomerase [Pseudooceanicola nanhaiensis]GGL89967.1 chaperone SurA [Pseudooceanicola nanhaiensis]
MTTTGKKIARLGALLTALVLGQPAMAQNLFAPVVKVGDSVVTGYELAQRTRMLEILNAPGDPAELAEKQLIEDRLKLAEAARFGITVSPEDLAAGKEEFAARANLSADEFTAALAQAGVAEESFDAFVRSGIAWRQLVRGRYGRLVTIDQQDIDRALTTAPNGEAVRVLISEIFIPTPPGREAEAQALAEQISQIGTLEGFADAARRYSAAPSGRAGGRVNWMPLADLPANLRGVILGLKPGQVSRPLPIPGALALFQLRAIEEGGYKPYEVVAMDYAAYYIAGGRSEEALRRAAEIKSRVDQCDDLYGIAQGQPPSVLDRGRKTVGEIPQDVAYELAKLDKNEVSTGLTRSNGQTLVFLMLCDRETQLAAEVDEQAVQTELQNQQIDRFANQLLARLKAETRIVRY